MFKSSYRYSFSMFGMLLCLFSINIFAAQTFQLDNGEVLNDPTKPDLWNVPQAARQGSAEPTFELNYIVVSAGQKRAMINGEKVLEGDSVSGAKVTRITQNSVQILYKGKRKELRINKVNGIQRSK